MKFRETFLSVGLLALTLGLPPGCKKDEPPAPKPETNERGARARGKMNLRSQAGAHIDPQAMKDYRLDVCYYGALSLFQARDAYLESLGKEEPSEKKIPSFGLGAPPAAAAAAVAGSAAASAAPAAASAAAAAGAKKKVAKAEASAEPSAAPSAAAVASAATAPGKHGLDFARAPYERNARACIAAAALKEPVMADVDAALKEFAPFSAELAKNIVTANSYYAREDFKKDGFEKGKTLHKALVEGFAKLDDLHEKLGTALTAWRTAHPSDTSKLEEGQRLVISATEDGRPVLVAFAGKKPDQEAFKAASAKLSADLDALKTFAQANPMDMWGKIVVTPLETYVRAVKDAEAKFEPHDSELFLAMVNGFVGLVEARQRGLSRSMNHGQMQLGPRGPGHLPLGHAPAAAKPEAPVNAHE